MCKTDKQKTLNENLYTNINLSKSRTGKIKQQYFGIIYYE